MSTATFADGQPGSLPVGIAAMAPGPELAALLASVDRSTVMSQDLPELLRARARLLAFEQAEFLLDLVEAVHGAAAEPGSTQRYDSDALKDDAAVEVGWALRWSESWAAGQIELAQDLVGRLPMVFDALRAGRLDRERAFAFVDSLRFVDEPVARAVAAKLVDRAERWTLGQLRDKLRYHIDRADPASKRRRYRAAVAERGVWLRGNDDGTANLSGVNLPPHRAAAAFDRIDRVARAARRDGDGRNLSQLRADAFTDLLAGVPFRLAPCTDAVTAEADAQHPVDDPGPRPPGLPHRRKPGPGTGSRMPGVGTSEPPSGEHPGRIDLYDYDEQCLTDEDRWWLSRLPVTSLSTKAPDRSADRRPDPARPADPGAQAPAAPAPAAPACSDRRLPTGDREHASADRDGSRVRANVGLGGFSGAPLPGDRCACGGLLPPRRPASADIQLELTTLAGLDEHPALIVGLGPVPAELARLVALDRQANPVWRWSVFDDEGELRHHGYTTQRPTTGGDGTDGNETDGNDTDAGGSSAATEQWCRCARYDAAQRRGVVELQLSTTTLAELTADPALAPGYQAVIADITGQVDNDARSNPPGKWSEVDSDGNLRHHGHTGRHPDTAEAAFIRARDRSCRTPTCRKPASRCEIDHRHEYAKGGPSHRGNCDCRCRRHHGIRHRTGFKVTKQGRITSWTTRNGRTYPVPLDKDIKLTGGE